MVDVRGDVLRQCTVVMSTVNSDDFGSLMAFASQLIFVLHDCRNQIGGEGRQLSTPMRAHS